MSWFDQFWLPQPTKRFKLTEIFAVKLGRKEERIKKSGTFKHSGRKQSQGGGEKAR